MAVKKLFDSEAFAKAVQDSKLQVPQVAAKVGCSVSDIYRYIRGESTPRMERLKKLVELLGPSISGLALVENGKASLQRFTQEEQRFLAFFRGLSLCKQARLLGYCEAVFAYGNNADPEFAAAVAEQLVLENQQRQGQLG